MFCWILLEREWGAESNEKLQQLCISRKTVTMVPEFAVEYLPLGWTATLVPEFAVKDLPLCSTLWRCYSITVKQETCTKLDNRDNTWQMHATYEPDRRQAGRAPYFLQEMLKMPPIDIQICLQRPLHVGEDLSQGFCVDFYGSYCIP